MAEDKTLVEYEAEGGKVKVLTLYKLVRHLESMGETEINISWLKWNRPDARNNGQRDNIETSPTKGMVWLPGKAIDAREKYTIKTVFSFALKNGCIDSQHLAIAHRFRWEPVGKNLKPLKPYIVTAHSITLAKNKPKQV